MVALATGRQVHVRITDRGPFTGGRDIDLSLRAAEALGIVNRAWPGCGSPRPRNSSPGQARPRLSSGELDLWRSAGVTPLQTQRRRRI